jgi:tRNA_anti-like
MDDVVLMLEAPNQFNAVHANLDDADAGKAAKLTKGTEITVTCTGGGLIIGSPILRDCRL